MFGHSFYPLLIVDLIIYSIKMICTKKKINLLRRYWDKLKRLSVGRGLSLKANKGSSDSMVVVHAMRQVVVA